MPASGQFVLIISDSDALSEAVMRATQSSIQSDAKFLSLSYGRCASQLTEVLIGQVGLFVLDLFRHYPGGLRAEGITLAQRLARRGKRSLIISSLHCAGSQSFPFYWDVASDDHLADRIRTCINSAAEMRSSLLNLQNTFEKFLSLPPQH